MIKWKLNENRLDGYDEFGVIVAHIYREDDDMFPVIITADGFFFLFSKTPDVHIAKDVCKLALKENRDWNWWLEHSYEWLELQV